MLNDYKPELWTYQEVWTIIIYLLSNNKPKLAEPEAEPEPGADSCSHWAFIFPSFPSYHRHWTDISIFGIINSFLGLTFFFWFWSLLIMTKIRRKRLSPRSGWLCQRWKYLFSDCCMMEGWGMWKLNDSMNRPLVHVQILVRSNKIRLDDTNSSSCMTYMYANHGFFS